MCASVCVQKVKDSERQTVQCLNVCVCVRARVHVTASPALIVLMLPEELPRAALASGWAIDLTQRASSLRPPHPNRETLHPSSPLQLYMARLPVSRPRGYLPNAIKVL